MARQPRRRPATEEGEGEREADMAAAPLEAAEAAGLVADRRASRKAISRLLGCERRTSSAERRTPAQRSPVGFSCTPKLWFTT